MKPLKIYLRALVTYIVVDVAYQAAIGFHLMTHFVTSSPLKDVYVEPTRVGALLMLLFFAIIAFANLKLAIEPAIEAKSVRLASTRGAILGTAAYATLGLTNGWSLDGFPLGFSVAITLEGMLFSAVTSGLTTRWYLRRETQG